VNYRPGTPRYVQIADAIRRDLRGEGERIPSEHELCAKFKVSRPTVRQALDVLVHEGRLYRHAGRGTFSTATPGADPRLRVIGSVGDMIALGDETWFKLISRETIPIAANIAQALRMPPGSSAYRVVGVRHADNGPFQHVTAYVPPTYGAILADEDLSKTSLVGAIERQTGVAIKFMEQVADAALAPRQVAELLQVRPRTPLLCFERTYFSVAGEPVEHAVTYQSCRRYPYRVILSRSDRRS
jgi:GntR family transcriptional regulator